MSSEEQRVDTSRVFPGQEFRQAREVQGVTFDQLGRDLRLPERTLRAIESGQFDGLGGPVFVRGYIRAYARRLNLDPVAFVAAFDASLGIKEVAAPVRVVGTVATTPARQSRLLMRFGTTLFLLVIVATVVWWWRAQYSLEGVLPLQNSAPVAVDTADGNTLILPTFDDSQSSDAQSPIELAEQASGLSEVASAAQIDAAVSAAALAVPAILESEEMTETALAAAEDEMAAVAAVVDDALRLELTADSWLRVTDAGGKSLFNGIAKPGNELVFEGRKPLSVVIGRADAVGKIVYAGKPVDLTSVNSKNVARLTLP